MAEKTARVDTGSVADIKAPKAPSSAKVRVMEVRIWGNGGERERSEGGD